MEVDGAAAAAGPKPLTPEEEALRRNTDCVYFLASPLTCKKVRRRLVGLFIFPSSFVWIPWWWCPLFRTIGACNLRARWVRWSG
jgi:hypothetical protein